MTFTRIQKKEAFKKLSPEMQDFVMDNETTELISRYLLESGIEAKLSDSADTEILHAMLGLQALSVAIDAIAKLSNKNPNDLSKLKNNLENNIFSKIQVEKNTRNTTNIQEQPKIKLPNEKVIQEVGKKYSLNDAQIIKLVSKVTSAATNPAQNAALLETIVTDLGISRLLAEQIMSDLEKRVFQNPPKTNLTPTNAPRVPEIKPSNLPVIEKGEVAHDNPIKSPQIPAFNPGNKTEVAPVPQRDTRIATGPLVLNPIGSVKPIASQEPVQKPVPVPRFVPKITESPTIHQGKPINAGTEQVTPATQTPINMMDSKLNTMVKGISDVPPQATKPIQPAIPKPPTLATPNKYSADPYREAIN